MGTGKFSKIFLERFKICIDEIQNCSTIVDGVKLWIQLNDHIDTLRNQFTDNDLYNKFFDKAQKVMIKRTSI